MSRVTYQNAYIDRHNGFVWYGRHFPTREEADAAKKDNPADIRFGLIIHKEGTQR